MNLEEKLDDAAQQAAQHAVPMFVVCSRDPRRKEEPYESVVGDLVFPEIDRVVCRIDVHTDGAIQTSTDPVAGEAPQVLAWVGKHPVRRRHTLR